MTWSANTAGISSAYRRNSFRKGLSTLWTSSRTTPPLPNRKCIRKTRYSETSCTPILSTSESRNKRTEAYTSPSAEKTFSSSLPVIWTPQSRNNHTSILNPSISILSLIRELLSRTASLHPEPGIQIRPPVPARHLDHTHAILHQPGKQRNHQRLCRVETFGNP